ncbi:MAG TPA: sialidase family protein [Candidatus Limnocylindrales bacterium]|nr:sialidase family protein [Candidatus Limnocylindrales bacterium]
MHIRIRDLFTIHGADRDDPMGHLCEPRMTRLASGELVLSFRTGTLRYSPDGSPRLLRSSDDGRSWNDLGRPFDGMLPGQPGWDYRAAALTEVPAGGLLVSVVGLDRSSPDRPPWLVYNPDPAFYQGMIPIRNLLSRSGDFGQTWSSFSEMTGMPIANSSAQQLVRLPNGDILCPLETFKAFDEPGPWRYRVDVIRSRDGGQSWGESAPAHMSDPDGDPRNLMCWDPRLAVLSDGRLVQFYYAFLNRGGGEDPVHVGWSTDLGRTWSLPTSTGLRGQAMFPVPLADGGLIGFRQRRDESQSMVAIYSPDGGRTFDPESETTIYRHETPSGQGMRDGLDSVAYMNDMIHFTFGHPTGVALDGSRALLVWYAGDETLTEIRGAVVELA